MLKFIVIWSGLALPSFQPDTIFYNWHFIISFDSHIQVSQTDILEISVRTKILFYEAWNQNDRAALD